MRTTTYRSTNSRPCVDCGLAPQLCALTRCGFVFPKPPVIPGRLEDAYVFSGEIPMSITVTQDVPPVDTLIGALSWTGVMNAIKKGPQSHAEGSVAGRGVPVWSIACVFSGLVLMAVAAVTLTVVLPLVG